MQSNVAGRAGLLDILSWARPHDSETERRFCREFLDRVPGMTQDFFGNRLCVVGDRPATVLWSCHVDTVASKCGPQLLEVGSDGFAKLAHGKAGMSLGADDGAGVWIMLNMIAAGRPGLYVFHRGEERGCLGSAWIKKHTPELLDGIGAAVAFDRAGYTDVITHQAFGRTCSDAFAKSMAAQLNALVPGFAYKGDDTGIYTDTNEYAGLVPECSNLSVGYFGQHGPREELDLGHCEALLEAMLRLDASRLVIERDPSKPDPDDRWADWSSTNWREPDTLSGGDMKAYMEAVEMYPALAAQLLHHAGIPLDDFLDDAWAAEGFARDDYRPLAAA